MKHFFNNNPTNKNQYNDCERSMLVTTATHLQKHILCCGRARAVKV